ncbi:MAG: GYF domain-containing protein [Mariniblastus sp.]|nr:GYF domain-containing protein [Mariniblastus sp.]
MADAMIFVMDELAGQEHGPYSLAEIQTQIYQKKLKKKHLVRKSDYSQWFKAEDLLGKVFTAVEQTKTNEKQQAKDDKAKKKQQAKDDKEQRKQQAKDEKDQEKQQVQNDEETAVEAEELADSDPYTISEADKAMLSLYLETMRTYGDRLQALKDEPDNAELKQAVIQCGTRFAKITHQARAALPSEPIKTFDEDVLQADLKKAMTPQD